jgi:outer membrane protein OmpA-like peptidoglycan-associated protein
MKACAGLFAIALLIPSTPAAAIPIVFFDWDSSAVSAQAAAILDNIASGVKASGWGIARIRGSADRSGSAKLNRNLSCRRAEAVKRYLSDRGVAVGSAEIVCAGESAPLVQTPDGVHEPQNRYVLIEFGPGS